MARFLVSSTTAPFDALYELPPSVPSTPSMLAMLTRLPDRCSTMCVSACLHTRNVPVRFTRITRSHSAASSRWIGPPPATPAAFSTTSRRPWSRTTASTASRIDDSSATSATRTSPSGPGCRSTPTTFAPSSPKRRAHARPIPDAAPVTNATLPSRRPTTVCSLKRVLVVKAGGRSVKFALFYDIPVAKPFTDGKEHAAYKNTLEQAVLGEQAGFHSFWTVEHHFLEEYSHCSNPEVLYGAIAARTSTMRLGYGVRLLPKPYNHPVRSAESAAVLDLISNGRVDFGTGRSSTRAELEGFGVDPHQTREMWAEAIGHIVDCWTEDEVELNGKHWQMPRRRVQPKPIQDPHPPLYGATSSEDGHKQVGDMGLGLCSFAVGVPPEEVAKKIALYREAVQACTKPVGRFVHDSAA